MTYLARTYIKEEQITEIECFEGLIYSEIFAAMNWRVATGGIPVKCNVCLDRHVPKDVEVHDDHVNPVKRKLGFLLDGNLTF